MTFGEFAAYFLATCGLAVAGFLSVLVCTALYKVIKSVVEGD